MKSNAGHSLCWAPWTFILSQKHYQTFLQYLKIAFNKTTANSLSVFPCLLSDLI